jgi:hypothetical protein
MVWGLGWVGNPRAIISTGTSQRDLPNPFSEQWEANLSALVDFKKLNGHCLVPRKKVVGKVQLGSWVGTVRQTKDSLSTERIKQMDSLGFSWDPLSEQWERSFSALQKFKKRVGHCGVLRMHIEDGIKLGKWIGKQRRNKAELSPDRIRRLDSIGFIWDPLNEKWDEAFAVLQKFKEREGHCLVNYDHKEGGLNLGNWVSVQRIKKSKLPLARIQCLESLGFNWDPLSQQWEDAFTALQEFKKREGHLRVPRSHIESKVRLGDWIHTQRLRKKALTKIQVKRLRDTGFSFDPHTEQWELAFLALTEFYKKEGHCRVPQKHFQDGIKLGLWVGVQRRNKGLLTKGRLHRLNTLGFSWDPLNEQWEEAYNSLVEFQRREGHCRVPKQAGNTLGIWAHTQRRNKGRLSVDRINRLNAINFNWKPSVDRWEDAFQLLEEFHKRTGHTRVEAKYEKDNIKLGLWVSVQRKRKELLTQDRIRRLNTIGFNWDPRSHDWEAAFAALKNFREREGHLNVPRAHIEDGLKIGLWVSVQRRSKDSTRRRVPPDWKKRLSELGFSW